MEFNNLMKNRDYLGVCVFWHNTNFEKSNEILQALESNSWRFPLVQLVVLDTSRFPQIIYKYNAKVMNLQCYKEGTLMMTSSPDNVIETLEQFSSSLSPGYYEKSMNFNLFHSSSEKSGESTHSSFEESIANDCFGLVRVTEELKRDFNNVVNAFRSDCENVESFKQSIDVGIDGE